MAGRVFIQKLCQSGQDVFPRIFDLLGGFGVVVCTVPSDQVRLIGSTSLDSGLVLMERSVKERVGVLRDSRGGLLGTVLHTRRGLY